MWSSVAFWQSSQIEDFFLALATPLCNLILSHTNIKAEIKSPAQKAPTSVAGFMKAQLLPCLWTKNEVDTTVESGTCSALLGDWNIGIAILQATIIFYIVKFLLLPFRAKENSWRDLHAASLPVLKSDAAGDAAKNILQAQVKCWAGLPPNQLVPNAMRKGRHQILLAWRRAPSLSLLKQAGAVLTTSVNVQHQNPVGRPCSSCVQCAPTGVPRPVTPLEVSSHLRVLLTLYENFTTSLRNFRILDISNINPFLPETYQRRK